MKTLGLAGAMILSLANAATSNALEFVPDSIVYFEERDHSIYDLRTTLFRVDGTFQDLDRESGAVQLPHPPGPLNSGTYTYTVDPSDDSRGTLRLSNGTSGLETIPFTFVTPLTGRIHLSKVFTIYPRVGTDDLRNVSNRTWVEPAHTSITGFIVDGSKSRWVLVRCAGPALQPFGVSQPLSNPRLRLFSGSEYVAEVGSWSQYASLADGLQAAFELVGAFAFESGSADCAAIRLLRPGNNTLHAYSDGDSGEVLTEVYLLPFGQ